MVVQWPLGLWAKLVIVLVASLAGSLALTELAMRTASDERCSASAGRRDELGGNRARLRAEPDQPRGSTSGRPLTVPEPIGTEHRWGPAGDRAPPPDGEALRWKDEGRWIGLTYAALWNRVRATSLALQQRGVAAGDHVVILAARGPSGSWPTSPRWPSARWSARSTRASRMRGSSRSRGLRPRLLFVEDERQRCASATSRPRRCSALRGEGPSRITLSTCSGPAPAALRKGDAWQAGVDGLDRSAVATIVQTIDEEGVARGAVLTHGNVLHNMDAGLDELPLDRGDVVLSILPLSHMLERVRPADASRTAERSPLPSRGSTAGPTTCARSARTPSAVPLFLTHLVKGMRGGSVDRPASSADWRGGA